MHRLGSASRARKVDSSLQASRGTYANRNSFFFPKRSQRALQHGGGSLAQGSPIKGIHFRSADPSFRAEHTGHPVQQPLIGELASRSQDQSSAPLRASYPPAAAHNRAPADQKAQQDDRSVVTASGTGLAAHRASLQNRYNVGHPQRKEAPRLPALEHAIFQHSPYVSEVYVPPVARNAAVAAASHDEWKVLSVRLPMSALAADVGALDSIQRMMKGYGTLEGGSGQSAEASLRLFLQGRPSGRKQALMLAEIVHGQLSAVAADLPANEFEDEAQLHKSALAHARISAPAEASGNVDYGKSCPVRTGVVSPASCLSPTHPPSPSPWPGAGMAADSCVSTPSLMFHDYDRLSVCRSPDPSAQLATGALPDVLTAHARGHHGPACEGAAGHAAESTVHLGAAAAIPAMASRVDTGGPERASIGPLDSDACLKWARAAARHPDAWAKMVTWISSGAALHLHGLSVSCYEQGALMLTLWNLLVTLMDARHETLSVSQLHMATQLEETRQKMRIIEDMLEWHVAQTGKVEDLEKRLSQLTDSYTLSCNERDEQFRESEQLKGYFETEIKAAKECKDRDLWMLARRIADQDMKLEILIESRERLLQAVKSARAETMQVKVLTDKFRAMLQRLTDAHPELMNTVCEVDCDLFRDGAQDSAAPQGAQEEAELEADEDDLVARVGKSSGVTQSGPRMGARGGLKSSSCSTADQETQTDADSAAGSPRRGPPTSMVSARMGSVKAAQAPLTAARNQSVGSQPLSAADGAALISLDGPARDVMEKMKRRIAELEGALARATEAKGKASESSDDEDDAPSVQRGERSRNAHKDGARTVKASMSMRRRGEGAVGDGDTSASRGGAPARQLRQVASRSRDKGQGSGLSGNSAAQRAAETDDDPSASVPAGDRGASGNGRAKGTGAATAESDRDAQGAGAALSEEENLQQMAEQLASSGLAEVRDERMRELVSQLPSVSPRSLDWTMRFIDVLYKHKLASDKQRRSNGAGLMSLNDFLPFYLGNQYGSPKLVREHSLQLLRSVMQHMNERPAVLIFNNFLTGVFDDNVLHKYMDALACVHTPSVPCLVYPPTWKSPLAAERNEDRSVRWVDLRNAKSLADRILGKRTEACEMELLTRLISKCEEASVDEIEAHFVIPGVSNRAAIEVTLDTELKTRGPFLRIPLDVFMKEVLNEWHRIQRVFVSALPGLFRQFDTDADGYMKQENVKEILARAAKLASASDVADDGAADRFWRSCVLQQVIRSKPNKATASAQARSASSLDVVSAEAFCAAARSSTEIEQYIRMHHTPPAPRPKDEDAAHAIELLLEMMVSRHFKMNKHVFQAIGHGNDLSQVKLNECINKLAAADPSRQVHGVEKVQAYLTILNLLMDSSMHQVHKLADPHDLAAAWNPELEQVLFRVEAAIKVLHGTPFVIADGSFNLLPSLDGVTQVTALLQASRQLTAFQSMKDYMDQHATAVLRMRFLPALRRWLHRSQHRTSVD